MHLFCNAVSLDRPLATAPFWGIDNDHQAAMADCTFNNCKGNYISYNSIPVDDLFDDEDRVGFPQIFL